MNSPVDVTAAFLLLLRVFVTLAVLKWTVSNIGFCFYTFVPIFFAQKVETALSKRLGTVLQGLIGGPTGRIS